MAKQLIWTKETIAAKAKEYSLLTDFRLGVPGAYTKACQLGILARVTRHMRRTPSGNKQQLTLEQAADIARPYTTRGEFAKAQRSVYVLASRYGWLDEICAHMVSGRGQSRKKKSTHTVQ